MTPEEKELLDELLTSGPPSFVDPRFPEQRAFIESTAKMGGAHCTRRAGKSYGVGSKHFKIAYEEPRVNTLYTALTRDSAKRIMWKDVFKDIDRKLRLNSRFNESSLTITLPNESVIYILGMDATEEEMQKALGQKYKYISVDEAQSYTIDLEKMIYDVFLPALADWRGSIDLCGTPGNYKQGIFFDLTKDQDPMSPGVWEKKGWSFHRWGALQNPHIREQWLEQIALLKRKNPRIEETPSFQQNYLGRWVVDDSKLVYKFVPGRNTYTVLPRYAGGSWHYVLATDLGFEDDTSMTVLAWHDHDRVLYVLFSEKRKGLDITAVARWAKELQARYDFEALVIDGSNKQAVAELNTRHELPYLPAEKKEKVDFIELMNGDLISGHIKVNPATCEALVDEWQNLIWDSKSSKKQEHPGCANHATDGCLYGWRHCYSYLSEKPSEPAEEGTRQRLDQIAEELEAAAEERWRASKEEEQWV